MAERAYIDVEETEPWPVLPAWKRIVTAVLYAILPKANPDFDELYPKVRHWLLEVQLPEGLPRREIGLDESGAPIVCAPLGNNYGFWVDGPYPIEWKEYPSVEVSLFDKHWKVMTDRMRTTDGPE